MKKFKLVLAALTLASSMAFAGYTDVPSSHWANEAVTNLQNKGLLAPSVGNATVFNGDGVFSRYEVASMLYLSLNNTDENLAKKASKDDLNAMQLLVKDFSPELTKMGAKVTDIEKKLADLEKKGGNPADLEKKIGKKIDSLSEKIAKITITGDLSASQKIGMKDKSPGMEDLKYNGSVTIIGQTSPGVSTRIKTRVDEGKDVSVDAMELRARTDAFYVNLFRDANKKVPSFQDTMALFNGIEVAPNNGLIVQGKQKVYGNSLDITGVLFKTSKGDIYGLQGIQNLESLKKMGVDSKLKLTYIEKVSVYQPDDNNKENPNNAKSFYGFEGEAAFSPLSNVSMKFASEYAIRTSPGLDDDVSDETEYVLPIGNNEGMYIYGASEIGVGNIGKLAVSSGIYNSGTNFELGGLGNYSQQVFAEDGDIKLEANKKGFVSKVGFKVKPIPLNSDLVFVSYGSNFKDEIPKTKIISKNSYDIIKGKLGSFFDVTLEKDAKKLADLTTPVEELVEEDGKITYEPKITINLIPNMTEEFRIKYEDDKDAVDSNDKLTAGAKTFSLYADNVLMVGNKQAKFVGKIETKGLDCDTAYEADKKTTLETGYNFEIKDIAYGQSKNKFLLGGRYSFENKEGTEATKKNEDNTKYRLFACHEYKVGKMTVLYGVKYTQEMLYNSEKDKLEDMNSDDNVKYGIGFEYDYGNDVVLKLSYGDAVIAQTDDKEKFMDDKTSFADGQQDKMEMSVSAKF